jgi:hypothetical protein
MAEIWDTDERKYWWKSVPKKIPEGWALGHNQVTHTTDMHPGPNGFRCWFDKLPVPDNMLPCNCGWSGLPHYSIVPNERCWTVVEMYQSQAKEYEQRSGKPCPETLEEYQNFLTIDVG